MIEVVWFAGPDGVAHPYAVSGVTGKFLNERALNNYLFFETKVKGAMDAPLGPAFSDGVALVDGPCKNV